MNQFNQNKKQFLKREQSSKKATKKARSQQLHSNNGLCY